MVTDCIFLNSLISNNNNNNYYYYYMVEDGYSLYIPKFIKPSIKKKRKVKGKRTLHFFV